MSQSAPRGSTRQMQWELSAAETTITPVRTQLRRARRLPEGALPQITGTRMARPSGVEAASATSVLASRAMLRSVDGMERR